MLASSCTRAHTSQLHILGLILNCNSLVPITKLVAAQSGSSMPLAALCLALGLSASHTMIPPTPGPVLAAQTLQANLGAVMGVGFMVALFAAVCGTLFSLTVTPRRCVLVHHGRQGPASARHHSLPRRGQAHEQFMELTSVHEPAPALVAVDDTDADAGAVDATGVRPGTTSSDGEASSEARGDGYEPSLLSALLPTLLPVLLIGLQSVASLPSQPFGSALFAQVLTMVGHPVVALLFGCVAAVVGLPRRFERAMLSQDGAIGDALTSAAPVILVTNHKVACTSDKHGVSHKYCACCMQITGAGGALGHTLAEVGVGSAIATALAQYHMGVWLPIVVASALKVAQGSGTVAITVTSTLVSSLLPELGLESATQRVVACTAIGAGALILPGPNDRSDLCLSLGSIGLSLRLTCCLSRTTPHYTSFFWVFSRFTGLPMSETLRLLTISTGVMGVAAAVLVWIMSLNMVVALLVQAALYVAIGMAACVRSRRRHAASNSPSNATH